MAYRINTVTMNRADAEYAALEEFQGDFSFVFHGGVKCTFLVTEFLIIKPEFYTWFKKGVAA